MTTKNKLFPIPSDLNAIEAAIWAAEFTHTRRGLIEDTSKQVPPPFTKEDIIKLAASAANKAVDDLRDWED